jgi:hypothetical protein
MPAWQRARDTVFCDYWSGRVHTQGWTPWRLCAPADDDDDDDNKWFGGAQRQLVLRRLQGQLKSKLGFRSQTALGITVLLIIRNHILLYYY